MRPLLPKETSNFIERFGDFIDGELRSFEILSPNAMKLTLAGQDSARGFDWISMELEFHGVCDASLEGSDSLHLIDMSEGVSLSYTQNFTFKINASTFYIVCETIKYQEGSF